MSDKEDIRFIGPDGIVYGRVKRVPIYSPSGQMFVRGGGHEHEVTEFDNEGYFFRLESLKQFEWAQLHFNIKKQKSC